jgi:hypothetical protein
MNVCSIFNNESAPVSETKDEKPRIDNVVTHYKKLVEEDDKGLYEIIHEQRLLLNEKDAEIARLKEFIQEQKQYIRRELKYIKKALAKRKKSVRNSDESDIDDKVGLERSRSTLRDLEYDAKKDEQSRRNGKSSNRDTSYRTLKKRIDKLVVETQYDDDDSNRRGSVASTEKISNEFNARHGSSNSLLTAGDDDPNPRLLNLYFGTAETSLHYSVGKIVIGESTHQRDDTKEGSGDFHVKDSKKKKKKSRVIAIASDNASSKPYLNGSEAKSEVPSSGASTRSRDSLSKKLLRQPDNDSDDDTQTSQPLMRRLFVGGQSLAGSVKIEAPDRPEPTLISHVTFRGHKKSAGELHDDVALHPIKGTYQGINRQVTDPYNDIGLYTGSLSCRTDTPHGFGRMVYKDDEHERVYEGEWLEGRWHGRGKLFNANGDTYEGGFHLDERHGHGTYKWASGRIYVGEFQQDKRHGKGCLYFPDGSKYVGNFVNGSREGCGRCDFAKGGHYEGEWKDNKFCGEGGMLRNLLIVFQQCRDAS